MAPNVTLGIITSGIAGKCWLAYPQLPSARQDDVPRSLHLWPSHCLRHHCTLISTPHRKRPASCAACAPVRGHAPLGLFFCRVLFSALLGEQRALFHVAMRAHSRSTSCPNRCRQRAHASTLDVHSDQVNAQSKESQIRSEQTCHDRWQHS